MEKENSELVKKVLIDGEEYDLKIENSKLGGGRLVLEFERQIKNVENGTLMHYKIFIDEKGVRFSRGYYSSSDFCTSNEGVDECYLLEEDKREEKFSWSDHFPYPGNILKEGYVIIPFVKK